MMGYSVRKVKSIRMTDDTVSKLQELAEHYRNQYWFNRKMGYSFKKVTTADVIEHLIYEEYEKIKKSNT